MHQSASVLNKSLFIKFPLTDNLKYEKVTLFKIPIGSIPKEFFIKKESASENHKKRFKNWGTYRYLAAGGVAVGRLKLSLGAVGGSGAVAHHAQPTHHPQQQCP